VGGEGGVSASRGGGVFGAYREREVRREKKREGGRWLGGMVGKLWGWRGLKKTLFSQRRGSVRGLIVTRREKTAQARLA